MKRGELLALFAFGLAFNIGLAWFQHAPGYMDADYYYAGGLRLAQGQGFSEVVLWNYLDNPQSLPHASHGYWFPLASILAAGGMLLSGQQSFGGARLGFILVAALVPVVTALLSYRLTARREIALAAGLLGVFCGYHAPFMPTTDNFGIFMLLGGLFFFLVLRSQGPALFGLGVVAGLMNLARPDGLIWLALGLGVIGLSWFQSAPRARFSGLLWAAILFLGGYALVMGPWMARNMLVWGTPLTPAGSSVMWMTRYDETFAWPATRINMENWLAAGWQSAMNSRLEAVKLNAINTVMAQAGILLFPFILIGLWAQRKDLRVRLAVFAWLSLFVVMGVIFPFAGSRGSFFHAGAALQPMWFTAAVLGVDVLVLKARARGWFTPPAPRLFRVSLVLFMAALTSGLAYVSIIENDWNQFQRAYLRVEQMLVENGAQPADAIIVANAPGYYVTNGRAAIIVPDENLETVRKLAGQFGARFLVLEKTYYTDPMIPVYKDPENQPGLTYLGEFDGVRVFEIEP